MSQLIERQVSDEDYQLIEATQLGIPLSVYRLKTGYIRLFHWGGLLTFVISAALLITVIITGLMKDLPFSVLFSPLVIVLSGLLGGWFFLRIGAPQVRSMHVIVCEHGLLQVERMLRKNRVEFVHWEDILAVRQLPTRQEYIITRQGGKALALANFYQDIDELVALIRQRSGVA